VPEGLEFGTTTFGSYAHEATAQLLRGLCPEADFIFRIRPGQVGVDVEVVGEEAIKAAGFRFGEIKPLTESGQSSFIRQVRNWSLPGQCVPRVSVDECARADAVS
jgi:hypothetical protein